MSLKGGSISKIPQRLKPRGYDERGKAILLAEYHYETCEFASLIIIDPLRRLARAAGPGRRTEHTDDCDQSRSSRGPGGHDCDRQARRLRSRSRRQGLPRLG